MPWHAKAFPGLAWFCILLAEGAFFYKLDSEQSLAQQALFLNRLCYAHGIVAEAIDPRSVYRGK